MSETAFQFSVQARPGWQLRLHPQSLSPDPTYGQAGPAGNGIDFRQDIFPWRLLDCQPPVEQAVPWFEALCAGDPGLALELAPHSVTGSAALTVDFGTEVEGCLEVEFSTTAPCTIATIITEAQEELKEELVCQFPCPRELKHFSSAGAHLLRRDQRGFRYARVIFYDLREPVRIHFLKADCQFVFRERKGDFLCSDERWQRAWQTSVYTARLCTRPDTFWDGIKRDRGGWFGDGRIIKEAVDSVFHDPLPSRTMLTTLPVDDWACAVPIYSFDAIAMLRQHLLAYGTGEPVIAEAFDRVRRFLAWVKSTQRNADGLLIRDPALRFFGEIGFLDWSRMPVGGRFEELSWLQCKYAEGLRTAAQIAGWLGYADDQANWQAQAEALAQTIRERFWRPETGFLHTLNHVGEVENPHIPGWGGHYQRTYQEAIRLGPSGPTRQCNALAVLAGIPDDAMRRTILRQVFDQSAVEPVITAYFLYFELDARARCGDPAGALRRFANYLGGMLEDREAATLLEMYDPRVRDIRRFCNHFAPSWTWPLSYCHGWGAGLVPLQQRYLYGLSPAAPGWDRLRLTPAAETGLDFWATVPTRHGTIEITKTVGSPAHYVLPEAIVLESQPEGVVIRRQG